MRKGTVTVIIYVVPRKPWLAALLSLWTAGMGHVYAGALRRGVVVYLLAWLGSLTALVSLMVLPPGVGVWTLCVFVIGMEAAIVTDAVRTARRAPRPFVPRPYNRWYIYFLYPFTVGLLINTTAKHAFNRYVGETFKIPTGSMAPTILRGDYLYAAMLRGSVGRSDVVIFHKDGKPFVKRAIGIPGDTLAMRRGSLFVNGRSIPEPYAIYIGPRSDTVAPTRSTWGPIVVPPHHYFMLGDNRDNSLDSRYYGFVDADSVTQRPIGIYFSRDTTGAIRWNRIGRNVSR